MGKYVLKHGFTPDYTRWIHHGESHKMREEVVRPRVEHVDAGGGIPHMLDDYQQAQIAKGPLVQKSSTLAVEHSFYKRFQSMNTRGKKSACPTQKLPMKIIFASRNGAFPLAVSSFLRKPPIQIMYFYRRFS